jgi:hypothetical protein
MLAGGPQKESFEAAKTLPPGSRCVDLSRRQEQLTT